ncbi:MAG: hypothetical protein HFK05_03220 [Clostridia bacterium]|nr:hypothetical protein [Clostridia bacterium]
MLKKALKNYFSSALYIFVAMGIIYLILIIVVFLFVMNTVQNLGVMFGDISDLIGNSVSLSGNAVEEFIDYTVDKIDWNADFVSIVKQIMDTNWIKTSVEGFLHTLNVSTENFTTEFDIILQNCLGSVITNLVVAISLLFAGVYFAGVATGYLVRRKTAKKNMKQVILNFIFSPLFLALTVFVLMWLAMLIKGYVLILLVVLGLVYEAISLTQAWFIYGRGKIKYKQAVNLKNVGSNVLAAVIIIAIVIALFVLLSFISKFIAVLVIVPVAVYSVNIIGVNADSYISELSEI